MFGVSFSESANTTFAPRRMKAFAVDTNVYDGIITSSPGLMFNRRAEISKEPVHEFVINVFLNLYLFSKNSSHFLVNIPSPDILPEVTACFIYFISLPVKNGLLNGILNILFLILIFINSN